MSYAPTCVRNVSSSASFAAPATSQIPAAASRTASPSHGTARLGRTGARPLELLSKKRGRLLAVASPRDLSVRRDDVEGRKRLQPVLRRDGSGRPGAVEAPRRAARVEERRKPEAEVALVCEDARRVLGVAVDRDEGEALRAERAREL